MCAWMAAGIASSIPGLLGVALSEKDRLYWHLENPASSPGSLGHQPSFLAQSPHVPWDSAAAAQRKNSLPLTHFLLADAWELRPGLCLCQAFAFCRELCSHRAVSLPLP